MKTKTLKTLVDFIYISGFLSLLTFTILTAINN